MYSTHILIIIIYVYTVLKGQSYIFKSPNDL